MKVQVRFQHEICIDEQEKKNAQLNIAKAGRQAVRNGTIQKCLRVCAKYKISKRDKRSFGESEYQISLPCQKIKNNFHLAPLSFSHKNLTKYSKTRTKLVFDCFAF